MYVCLKYLLKIFILKLILTKREGEIEKEILYVLVYCSNDQTEARGFIHVSQVGNRPPKPWVTFQLPFLGR